MFPISNFEDATKNEKIIVPDLIPPKLDKLKYIFILESPHKTEVENKLPVCGKSGIVMRTTLIPNYSISCPYHFNCKKCISFGEYLKLTNFNNGDTAVINVSNIPMQNIILDNIKIYDDTFGSRLDRNRNNDIICSHISKSFSQRFKPKFDVVESYSQIIVCGRCAKKYFENAFPKAAYSYLPHPAYKHWKALTSEESHLIDTLKSHYNK